MFRNSGGVGRYPRVIMFRNSEEVGRTPRGTMFRNSGGIGPSEIPDGSTVTYHPWQRNATPARGFFKRGPVSQRTVQPRFRRVEGGPQLLSLQCVPLAHRAL
jgi:hypothetical protein